MTVTQARCDLVVSLLQDSLERLEHVWNRIGLAPVEREEEFQTLLRQTCELYQNRVQTEDALALAYEQELGKLKLDIEATMDVLDLIRSPDNEERGDAPLIKQLTKLRADFEQLDAKRRKMQASLSEKLDAIHVLCHEMRMDVPSGFHGNDKLTVERERELDAKLEALADEKLARQQHIQGFVSRAQELMYLLQISQITCNTAQLDHMIITGGQADGSSAFQLDIKSIRALETRVAELERERDMRQGILRALTQKVHLAFAGINESSEEFFAQYSNGQLGDPVLYAFEQKLAELLQERKHRIAEVIERARDEVRVVLEESRPSMMERSRVTALLSEPIIVEDMDLCEAQLRRCALEKEKLKVCAERIQPLVAACLKYIALCRERDEYEALIQDSSRLLNRSKRVGPTLQEEERMRKRVSEMPKFLASLKQQILSFERQYQGGEALIFEDLFGEDLPVLQVIEQNEREHQERLAKEKEQRMRNKMSSKNGATTSSANNNSMDRSSVRSACSATTTSSSASSSRRVPLAPNRSTGSANVAMGGKNM